MSQSHQGIRFGQRPPPISKLIKDLLEKYPNGQIFKELIQNADDAGAKVVRFYIDNREYKASSFINKRFAEYPMHGPALIAANDAAFTDKDWEGIQRLQDSIKAEDPFNVGKYGIGFNSVYHITDVPSILSGDRIVYLDPQETIWPGDPGQCFKLSALRGTDVLKPLSGIEEFEHDKTTNYPKTLFRFPLRVRKSGLSDNLYTPESLSELIDEIKDEAKFLLLFLHCVNTIEVYSIPQLERNKCELQFRVQIAPKDQINLIHQRMDFLKKLKWQHTLKQFKISTCITNVPKFDVNILDTSRQQSEQTVSWLVANQVGSSNKEILEAAEKQHVFPWVGVAIELSTPSDSSVDKVPYGDGRVFCFLPMPVEASSTLPVHVNGTFGLNDDRRTIKWPAKERKKDPTARWNQMLVTDCLPTCYNLLLKTAVKSNHISPELFYRAWPIFDSLDKDWSLLLKPLFSALFEWECLWANRCCSTKWVSVKKAPVLVIPESEPVAEVIIRVLSKLNLPLCDIPNHVFEAITKFETQVQRVSPPTVCLMLCNYLNSYQSEPYEDKLKLLRYCLQDETFCYLGNLELLPMANKTFRTFSKTASYLCSEEFPRKLLPNLDHKLVDLWEIDKDLHDNLKEVANRGGPTLKLKCLSASVLANLLPQCYPVNWKDQKIVQVFYGSQDFPFDWCKTFWMWIQHHDLSLFEDKLVVPLVTTSDHHALQLTKLSTQSSVVLIESDSFPSILVEAFTRLGVHSTFLKHVPYLQHTQRFRYFNSCNPMGVLNAISNSTLVSIQNVRMSFTEALVFQHFLASQKFDLNTSQVNILKRLCIFWALNQSSPVSLLEASKNSWKKKAVLLPNDFCFSDETLPSSIAVLSHTNNSPLLLQACKPLISMPDSLMNFLLDILFPMIRKQHCPEDKIDPLMTQVLRYYVVLKRDKKGERFKTELSNLNFICVEGSSCDRKPPSKLYDCSNHLLKNLFDGSHCFPHVPYDAEEMLVPLRECGLHTTVSGQELINIILDYAHPHSKVPQITTTEQFLQAKAVFAYIENYPDILHENILLKQHAPCPLYQGLNLLRVLKNWLPVVASSPDNYPQCLTWKGSGCLLHLTSLNDSVLLCKSDNIAQVSSIVGSQVYMIECPSQLVETLGKEIPAGCVLKHLVHVIENQRSMESSLLNTSVHRIYSFLNSHLDQLRLKYSTDVLHQQKLIWMKKQHAFVAPDQFVFQEHPTFQHNLTPFYQVLPESLSEYSELLVFFGVHRELTDSDIVQVLKKIKDDDRGIMVPNLLAWEMVTSILNWLTNHGQTPAKEKLARSDILYVPVESDSVKDRPQLANVEDVVYTDLPFLKNFESSRKKTLFIEGKFLPLATLLGVKRLSTHWDISHDAFGDVGPHEPLVNRLRTILKDYKGTLTIIKELIQNADDAGATEVNICYDDRTHSVEPNTLLFQGMANCHGPALLVHNNATFKEKDFENITKLAGATKRNEPLKIGQFGIGFCSVYHITDVPSFISGEWLYIFDPAILFLESDITNQAKPGKKLKLTEEIVHSSNHLVPYQNLFGFQRKKSYPGTMFRFPFRTYQDDRSISNVCFKKRHVQNLLADIKKAGSKLFLFLNNVKRITFNWIDTSDRNPTELFAIIKKTESTISMHTERPCEIQQIIVKDKIASSERWLTAHSTKDLRYCDHDGNTTLKAGTASVACCLQSSSHYLPQKLKGEMFCYLPLLKQTGLPIHVSANFAVLSDRSGIHATDSDSPNEEVQWNIELCKNLIPKAYFLMLRSLCQLCHRSKDEYKFYHLWPLENELKTHNPWKHVLSSLYEQIANSKLFYSECISSWLQLSQSRMLSNDVLQTDKLAVAVDCVNQVVKELCLPMIDLPSPYLEYFSEHVVQTCTIYENEFIDIFFNRIDQIPSQVRNEILFHMFRVYTISAESKVKLMQHLTEEKCIPHTPDGNCLKKCSEIVDPSAYFASLYDDSDEVFPIDKFHKDNVIHLALVKLGIIHTRLPWEMILQRVETIPILYCMEETRLKALQRTLLVLKCIEDQLNNMPRIYKQISPHVQQLTNIGFIPVAKRPKDYPKHLKWLGDVQGLFHGQSLLQGNQNVQLAGSQVCLVMEGEPEEGGCGPIPHCVANAFGIRQYPSCEMVVSHLLQIADMYIELCEDKDKVKPWVESACEEIYKYFDQMLSQRQISSKELEKLNDSKSIWTGTTFISSSSIAKSWSHRGPYLYGIPYTLMSKESLIAALKIQEEFQFDHFMTALRQIFVEYVGKPLLDPDVFKTVHEVSTDLFKRIRAGKLTTITLREDQACFLPDTDRIMRKTTDLAFNDAPWVQIDHDSFFVHEIIQRDVAIMLGITPVRSKVLQPYEHAPFVGQQGFCGKPFGQHEDLKQRIRNILCDYPRDITVLKELLQNADDAKAKKMYVILDKRKHGIKKVLSPEWQDLQGPALLVWNDSGMSDKDLEGIQELGHGGKRCNEDAIGQYGIGFNVVYHLTDCPSFLTNGDTLCILDPHHRYVPGAGEHSPGRQFDNIDDHFWSNFSDMKSTYLRDTDERFNCLRDVREQGTLFRFPLRHSNKLVTKSDLVSKDKKFGSSDKPLPAWQMEKDIQQWAPKIKEALFFLNNVEEIKFFMIEENRDNLNPVVILTHHYKVQLMKDAANVRDQFLQKTSNKSNESAVAHYQVSLSELAPKKEQEEWLIHQGIENQDQYLQSKRLRHGIAAQISGKKFDGKVFCFLPLPIESKLPIHINGNFALDAARSGLRHTSGPDEWKKWNLKLIEALASSYVDFLVGHKDLYVYVSPKTHNAVQNYYNWFPLWKVEDKPEREMLVLAKQVFQKLSEQNSPVLAVILDVSGHPNPIQWLPLLNKEEPSKQVYFWKKPDKEEHKALLPILKRIGVQLTAAPITIQRHFTDIQLVLPLATPETMFEYYCSYYTHMSEEFPCPISETKFESETNFIKFVRYVIQETHFEDKAGTYFTFPGSPTGIPLLLTADKKLHQFSEDDRVICSKFTQVFTDSSDRFVHPDMCKLNLVPSYFIEPLEDNWELISAVLKEALPECLMNKRLSNTSKHNISVQNLLVPLWQCFLTEEVFKIHLNKILKEWSLLFSKQNELFSCNSPDNLVPVIPPQGPTSRLHGEVFKILESSGMPILDIDVVSHSICKCFCPQIDQPARMLQNLCNLYRSDGLESLQKDKTFEHKIVKLFTYFGEINFSKEQDSLDRIKSLPLFKNIDNTYTSLTGEAYVWPSHICLIGWNVWMDGIKTSSIVFLKSDGAWSKLGPASTLGINVLSPLSVYTKFIFPYFSLLSEEDRLKHLKHVRDTPQLFGTACYDSKSEITSDRQTDACSFMNALKQLPCIWKNDELRKVCTFCDPDIPLFKEFTDIYDSLPEGLTDKKWLKFFRHIGLKMDINKQEFINLCKEIAHKQHRNSLRASTALLKYLFDRDQHEWHKDINFLKEVSKLPFVCADPVRNFTSIVPTMTTGKAIRSSKETVHLTSLNEAASKEIDYLIWTVMPVVRLPRLFYVDDEIPPWKLMKMREKFYENLSICQEPDCIDVVQNLLNIAAQSGFTNFDLFEKYDEELYHKGKIPPLFEAVVKCFNYLSRIDYSEDLLQLQGTPCIPVSANGDMNVVYKPVLVHPCQVIADSGKMITELVPFLNPLPEELYSALPTVLSVIGVTKEIRYDNVRHALQVMHNHICQPLDPNTTEILKSLLKHLYHWLCRTGDFSAGCEVLYLPNDQRELVNSTELLYNDRNHYRNAHLKYKFMSLLVHELEEREEYGFCLRDLYYQLPESVRPCALSCCCEERLSSNCKQNLRLNHDLTDFATKIKQALSHPYFARISAMIIKAQLRKVPSHCYSILDQFEKSLASFHQSVTVHSVRNLEIDVLILDRGNGPTHIGTATVDFLLESSCDCKTFSLYIDSYADALTLKLFESLTKNIVSCVARMNNIDISDFFIFAEEAIGILLKDPSPDQLKKLLNDYGMNTVGLHLHPGVSADFKPKLGQPIPHQWYHCLQSDIRHVFRSHEWVGYEDKEHHIIFARVEYRREKFHDTCEEQGSVSEDEESWISEELDSYKIMISDKKEEEEEVTQVTATVVELYKILRVKQVTVDGSKEMVLYDPEGTNSIISQELKQIWRLRDVEQRIKAIKAMHLKWHPGKNPHPRAKEAFQFLQDKIKHHEQEDREHAESHDNSESLLDKLRHEINEFICSVNDAQQFEQERSSESQSSSSIDMAIALCQVKPNPDKAEKWLKQAEYDLKALQILFQYPQKLRLSAHVCFLGNQVAEKALRAGMYALIGLQQVDLMHHDIINFAEKIEANSSAGGLRTAAASLNHDIYLNTRYPNRHGPEHEVPSLKYTREDAIQCKESAEKLMEIIRTVVRH